MPAQPKASRMFQHAAVPRAAADTAKPQGILHLLGKIKSHKDTETYKHLQQLHCMKYMCRKRVEIHFASPLLQTALILLGWIRWAVMHRQTSPCVVLFHPFLWQTFQDERPVLAILCPPTGLWQHHIIATTEHKLNTQTDPQAKEHLDFSNAD